MAVKRLGIILALVLLGVATYQPLTRGYLFANIGTLFTWSGSAQSWSGSTQVASCADYHSFIRNDGTACPAGNPTLLDSFAIAHAVNIITHTPIVANNTFRGGNFASWTSTNAGSCAGYLFSGYNVSDQDGDAGLAFGSSASCTANAKVTLSQSVSISGTPTSQTYSFWYMAPAVSVGDPINCTAGSGSASLSLVVNATTVITFSPTLDGNWHRVNGSLTALASGANTITVNASLAAAQGQNSRYNPKIDFFTCLPAQTVAQPMYLDDFVFTANW